MSLIFFSVRSFGTEDRPTDRPVPAREEVFEYIIFRGTDIKDIHVCEPPKPPQVPPTLNQDPAIVKVRKVIVRWKLNSRKCLSLNSLIMVIIQ